MNSEALLNQQRESANVLEPVNDAQVIEYSYVETVRKELGMARRDFDKLTGGHDRTRGHVDRLCGAAAAAPQI